MREERSHRSDNCIIGPSRQLTQSLLRIRASWVVQIPRLIWNRFSLRHVRPPTLLTAIQGACRDDVGDLLVPNANPVRSGAALVVPCDENSPDHPASRSTQTTRTGNRPDDTASGLSISVSGTISPLATWARGAPTTWSCCKPDAKAWLRRAHRTSA